MKVIILLLLAVAVSGQDLCLPNPVVELNVDAVIRSQDANLCDNTAFDMFLEDQIMSNYLAPSEIQDEECRLESISKVSCTMAPINRGRMRFTHVFRTNLTCSSEGCNRQPDNNKDTFHLLQEMKNTLRTAMRHSRKVSVNHVKGTVRIAYFKGQKASITQVCRAGAVSSIRDKITLCSCPEDCPTEEVEIEPPTCSQNMVYNDCGSACPASCDKTPQFCTLQCVQGCFCPPDMVAHDGGCILPKDCPNKETPTSAISSIEEVNKECSGARVYRECGSACPATCDNRFPICLALCKEGCFCPSGTVEHNGECIAPEECPSVEEEVCSDGKVYQECGSPCLRTCSNREPFCTAVCKAGCFCPTGMVEHDRTCISPEECPSETTTPAVVEEVVCTGGKTYQESCTTVCKAGCFCPSETVEHNGECIAPPSVEEEVCSDGKVYQECGSPCLRTCSNREPFCTAVCKAGCFCPTGMVVHDGTCISPEECPSEATTPAVVEEVVCTGGKTHQECGSNCPPTCDNKTPFCIFVCREGCFCPIGMVDNDGTCVSPDECPEEEEDESPIINKRSARRNGRKGNKERPTEEDSTSVDEGTTTSDDCETRPSGGRKGRRKGGCKGGDEEEPIEEDGERGETTPSGRPKGRKNKKSNEEDESSGDGERRRGRGRGRRPRKNRKDNGSGEESSTKRGKSKEEEDEDIIGLEEGSSADYEDYKTKEKSSTDEDSDEYEHSKSEETIDYGGDIKDDEYEEPN